MSNPISVCIATFRRPQRLLQVLNDLAAQTLKPHQVVVVDNDAAGSAQSTVELMRGNGAPFKLVYEIQPERSIPLTRNRTVALADQEWLAFIDDDERAPATWLQQLMNAAVEWKADGIIAPVLPQVPEQAPAWIRSGRFYDFPRLATGAEIPLNQLRFGNILLRGELVRAEPGPFDLAYGLTTGEDADMLLRLIARGGRILWCDEAIVHEPIEAGRLSLRWLIQRAYSGGQEFSRKTLSGRYGPVTFFRRAHFLADGLTKLGVAVVLVPLAFPLGRHRAAHWLIRAAANLGKLTAFLGWNYREYKTASVSTDEKVSG